MKKILILLTLIVSFISTATFSQRYAFDKISDELKIGANAVYRIDEKVFTVESSSKSKVKRKVAITLLNETAENYRFPDLHYSKFEKISGIKGSIYDEKGDLVEVIKSSNILDRSINLGGSFHSDSRVKTILFPLIKYPYTIEYEYELSINGIISYPTWYFQKSPYASVESSGIQFIVPNDVEVKFLEVNLPVKIDTLSIDDHTIYTWRVDDLPAIQINQFASSYYRFPILYASPVDFEIEGYKGSTRSWETFGNWNNLMIENRDELPEKEMKKVQELVKDINNEREKVKVIYEYMQSKTRYMNIILGIGGWQPIPANEVATKGYGDCKALSNYTMALLKAAGIKSYYTLINSGVNEEIYPEFVSNQFNHVILCVPQENDTIWLECTNQTFPFNYLGLGNSDRHALLITEEGGKIVRTPDFKKQDNVIKTFANIKLNANESITKASVVTQASGMYYGQYFGTFGQQSEEGIKRELNSNLNFHTFEVDAAKFDFQKSENPNITLQYDLNIRNFASSSESRLYFEPSFKKEGFILDEPFGVRISEYTTKVDSLIYEIPSGYLVEYLPQNKQFDTKFGKYIFEIKPDNEKIYFTRFFELNKGIYSIDEFSEFYNFINSVANSDRERIVLRKKEI